MQPASLSGYHLWWILFVIICVFWIAFQPIFERLFHPDFLGTVVRGTSRAKYTYCITEPIAKLRIEGLLVDSREINCFKFKNIEAMLLTRNHQMATKALTASLTIYNYRFDEYSFLKWLKRRPKFRCGLFIGRMQMRWPDQMG